jgi:hypothetical protein
MQHDTKIIGKDIFLYFIVGTLFVVISARAKQCKMINFKKLHRLQKIHKLYSIINYMCYKRLQVKVIKCKMLQTGEWLKMLKNLVATQNVLPAAWHLWHQDVTFFINKSVTAPNTEELSEEIYYER